MLRELGEALKSARQERSLSLQAVADPADITAPYLQKLERGLVNTPSPRVLARLSLALGISYLRLMELAGYLDEPQLAEAQSRRPKPHPLLDQDLSPAEWSAVGDFIRTLRGRRKAGPAEASETSRRERR
jgi:transcriptional regulator with XRE-family HTH domain